MGRPNPPLLTYLAFRWLRPAAHVRVLHQGARLCPENDQMQQMGTMLPPCLYRTWLSLSLQILRCPSFRQNPPRTLCVNRVGFRPFHVLARTDLRSLPPARLQGRAVPPLVHHHQETCQTAKAVSAAEDVSAEAARSQLWRVKSPSRVKMVD
jgi:hypothetical protein